MTTDSFHRVAVLPTQGEEIKRARALLIGATLLWGLSFPLIRALELTQEAFAPGISASALACVDMVIRFGLAALFLLPFYGRDLMNVTGREWSQAGGLALLAGAGLYLQTLGLAWADASVSAFLTQLYTLIVPVIVAMRDRRVPSLRVVFACGMVLCGAALLSPGLLTHLTLGAGELVVLLSTVFFAGQIVWVERPIYSANRSGVVTLLMFSFLGGIFAALYFGGGGSSATVGRMMGASTIWVLMITLILLCTIITFWIMNAWQSKLTATEAGIIYCIEPVVATLLSAFLPGWISRWAGVNYANELLSWGLLGGGLLIILATILVVTEKRHSLEQQG